MTNAPPSRSKKDSRNTVARLRMICCAIAIGSFLFIIVDVKYLAIGDDGSTDYGGFDFIAKVLLFITLPSGATALLLPRR
jgi:hypothetical protein